MAYRWAASGFGAITAVPTVAVDDHLRLAGKAAVKVLLWLARHGCDAWAADVCAQACGLTAAAAEEGLSYWVAAGVIADENAPAIDEKAVVSPSAAVTAAVTAAANAPVAVPTATPLARPTAVKPTVKEVLAHRKNHPDFGYLLDAVSARLGKPLTHGDMETLLFLVDTAGVPVAVVQMIVEYAAAQGKYHMRYIERIGLDWSDRGIVTVEAAEEQLCALERRRQAWQTVSEWLELTVSPTMAQSDAAERWICEWKTPAPLVRLAAQICREKTGKFQCQYISRILERWRNEGIDTVEKAEAAQSASRAKKSFRSSGGTATKEVSYNLQAYESWANEHTPVYHKKKKGDRP